MEFIKKILSIPKTIYFNFKVFPIKYAVHFPFWIAYNTKIKEVHKGSIILNNYDKKRYHIKFRIWWVLSYM